MYTVTLDPPAVATGRTALSLNSGAIRVEQTGVDWGDAAITAFEADMQRYGSVPASYRIPNRTVTVPLGLGMDDSGTEEAVRAQLQQKVALFQREGGWLLRQRTGGPAMYADVVNATLTEPDRLGEAGGVEPAVTLILECLPDFYGDPVTLDVLPSTGVTDALLKLGGTTYAVPGDHPARCEIQVKDTSGNNQDGLLWGVQYDNPAATLTYNCKDLTLLNGTAATALTGSYSGTAAEIATPIAGTWMPLLSTGMLTQTGAYRVWLRAYSNEAPQLRLAWTAGVNAVYGVNDVQTLPGSGAFYLVDLGEIWIEAPPDGPCQWNGVISLLSTEGLATWLDKLFLQPLDQGAGLLQWNPQPAPAVVSVAMGPTTGADVAVSGAQAWANPGNLNSVSASPTNFPTQATATVSTASTTKDTDLLEGTGFGLGIPTGATIQGISVKVHRKAQVDVSSKITDKTVQLLIAGAQAGSNRSAGAQWGGSYKWVTFGGPTDLWGLTPTVAQLNASNFGVALQAHLKTGAATSANAVAKVNGVTITVYFTLAGGIPVTQDAVIYANATALLRHDGMWRYGPSNLVASPVPVVGGDLARIPPSGMEGRAVRMFVKPTRGDADQLADSGIDAFTVTPTVRPCYLHRP